jgi:DNA-binding NarL/FixJ family response regulator
VAAHKPDVAIVDVQMPPDNTDDGLRAAMEIRASQPSVGVLVLSQFAEERYAVDLIGDDAAGAFDADVVLVSTLDADELGDGLAGSGARGFVGKAQLASPLLVELLGPP